MLSRILSLTVKTSARSIATRNGVLSAAHGDLWYGPERAAGREVVGHGFGDLEYFDRVDHPYPAIRFRKEDDAIRQLRNKEKQDWSQLSLDDKSALYRASFRLSFAEMDAPNGHWKVVAGMTMTLASVALWIVIYLKTFVFSPMPESFSEREKEIQLQRMIDLHANPITGYASKWDYEKNQWKA